MANSQDWYKLEKHFVFISIMGFRREDCTWNFICISGRGWEYSESCYGH